MFDPPASPRKIAAGPRTTESILKGATGFKGAVPLVSAVTQLRVGQIVGRRRVPPEDSREPVAGAVEDAWFRVVRRLRRGLAVGVGFLFVLVRALAAWGALGCDGTPGSSIQF